MNQFRLASRQLFNDFFRLPGDPWTDEGWELERRFAPIERLMFQKMVLEPEALPAIAYGEVQPSIAVRLRNPTIPALVNREVDSGYWDFPLAEIDDQATLAFVCFFDWAVLEVRDHQYVRVKIAAWPSHPEVVDKHALIEARHVTFDVSR